MGRPVDRHDTRGVDDVETVGACEPIRPLLPLLALGALDPDDAPAVARHLVGCRRCRLELGDYAGTVDWLALVAPERQPPERLRRRLLASLHPEPWAFAALSRRWLAAAAVLLLLLAGSNLFLWQQLASAQRSATQAPVERVSAGPLTWYDLASLTPGTPAQGTLCAVPDGHLAWLIVQDLPPLAPGRVYQLWFADGEHWVSGGTFMVDQRGRGFLTVWPDPPLASYQTLDITVEPEGGSPRPTGRSILSARLA